MAEREPKSPVARYLESATAEEQRKFSAALLSRKAIAEEGNRNIPATVVVASRFSWFVIAVLRCVSVGWSDDLFPTVGFLIVLGAIACLPNETAAATGRLGLGPAVSRPSNPWFLFVLAWVFLLLMGGAATMKLVGAA